MAEQQEAPQFQIELPDEIGQGQYANLVLVHPTQSEFIIDFIRAFPGLPSGKVHSRQVLTPDNAKRLLRQLEHQLRGYEQEFGTISLPEEAAQQANAN